MRKIITVQFEVEINKVYNGWSNSALVDQFNEYEDILDIVTAVDSLAKYTTIAVNDATESEKADADA